MEVLGYLLTLSVLHNKNNLFDTIKDFSITVDQVGTLADDIFYEISRSDDGANKLKRIHETGYLRDEDIGIYCTKNIRDYIFHGNVSSQEEGMILTLFYNDQAIINRKTGRKDEDTDFSIFVSNKGIDFTDVQNSVLAHFAQ